MKSESKSRGAAARRRLTVGHAFYPQLRSEPNANEGDRLVPGIRLRGQWLERAGFDVGTPLTIRVYRKRLVICVD